MPIRNTHRVGDYLLVDDLTGLVHYRSEMVRIWDGSWVHHSNYETRNPQEFVYALDDPKALAVIRPDTATTAVANYITDFIGETSVSASPFTPAGHLFKPGIGTMQIEGDNPLTVFDVEADA